MANGCRAKDGDVSRQGQLPVRDNRRFQNSKSNREIVDDFQNHESVLKLHKIYIVLI
jgi:hypothetical protein